MKKYLCRILVAGLILAMTRVGVVSADALPSVVINEVAWAGSSDSAADEWIELYNASGQSVDISGWRLLDDGVVVHTFESGVLEAGGYFLIEKHEDAVSTAAADLLLDMSLANTGDSLELLDANGVSADIVNGDGGDWPAGNSASKATMERIDPLSSGNDPANWAANTASNGALASSGSEILGTPGSLNSVSEPPAAAKVKMSLVSEALSGKIATVMVSVSDVSDLLSYEADLAYDPAFLSYQDVTQDTFLSQNGDVSTAFYSGLEDGIAGKLVVAEARLGTESGVSGNGDLFSVNFMVSGKNGESSELNFSDDSFLANSGNDIEAEFENLVINLTLETPTQVLNLQISPGEERYTGLLAWEAAESGADFYKVMRKSALGEFEELGTTDKLKFLDSADLVPGHEYSYQVVAVLGDLSSNPVAAVFTETRGLKGDNNRSDRVDGRDLQNLAKLYTAAVGDDDFDPLADTTYDGVIDGSDLIDIGVNWAKTYSE